MKFGLCLPIRLYADARSNVEIAVAAEKAGFDSVWASDHVIVPVKRAGMFNEYFCDPFVLLAYIAARTSGIRIGTSVIILPYRNPVVAAKMAATLDVLSGGRVIFGVGAGWLREEFEALGVPYDVRGKITDEYINAIKTLWETGAPEFSGEFCSFSGIKFYPKPIQKPRPPIWVGGSSRTAVRRAALLGDGWQPTWKSPEAMEEGISAIKTIAEKAGRDMSGFTFSVRNRLKVITPQTGGNGHINISTEGSFFTLRGTVREIAELVERYGESGVTHLVFDPDADDFAEIILTIEAVSEEIIPVFRDA